MSPMCWHCTRCPCCEFMLQLSPFFFPCIRSVPVGCLVGSRMMASTMRWRASDKANGTKRKGDYSGIQGLCRPRRWTFEYQLSSATALDVMALVEVVSLLRPDLFFGLDPQFSLQQIAHIGRGRFCGACCGCFCLVDCNACCEA